MTDSKAPLLDPDHDLLATKPRSFRILMALQLVFSIYLVVDLWIDLHQQRNMTAGPFIVFLLIILFPIAGTVLLFFKKKPGWIISVIYFGFIGFIMGAYMLQQIILQRIAGSTNSDLRIYVLFLLAAMVLIFLVTRENRDWLGIGQKMLILTLGITLLIALPLAFLFIFR